MRCAPIGEAHRAARCRISGPITPTEAVQHHLGPVFELNTEPIPSNQLVTEITRAEFVIHPACAADGKFLAADRQRSCGDHPR